MNLLWILGPLGGNCDFEAGLCHWNNSAFADMKWYHRKGSTLSVNTGPSTDASGNANGES